MLRRWRRPFCSGPRSRGAGLGGRPGSCVFCVCVCVRLMGGGEEGERERKKRGSEEATKEERERERERSTKQGEKKTESLLRSLSPQRRARRHLRGQRSSPERQLVRLPRAACQAAPAAHFEGLG